MPVNGYMGRPKRNQGPVSAPNKQGNFPVPYRTGSVGMGVVDPSQSQVPVQHQYVTPQADSANMQLMQNYFDTKSAARNSLHQRTMGTYAGMGQPVGPQSYAEGVAQIGNRNLTPADRHMAAINSAYARQTPGSPEPMGQPPKPLTDDEGRLYLRPQNGSAARFDEGIPTGQFRSTVTRTPTGGLALQGAITQDRPGTDARIASVEPGQSLQYQNRQRDVTANQARGAAMAAARQGRSWVRPTGKQEDSPLDKMLNEMHLAEIAKQINAVTDPAEKLALIQQYRGMTGKGKKAGLPILASPAPKPSMGSTLGAALGYDMTPGKPLYPGRFGGY